MARRLSLGNIDLFFVFAVNFALGADARRTLAKAQSDSSIRRSRPVRISR